MDSMNGFSSNGNGSEHPEVAPSFLFGSRTQKRKSLVLGGGGRATPSFGSPGILKKDVPIASPGGKNVRWSSDLVQEQSIPGKLAATSPGTPSFHTAAASPWSAAPSTFLKGPPLRSITHDDVEPPAKLQRPDVHLEGRESAINAINGAANAFNNVAGEPDDYWVTVFGFTAEDRDMILNVFARHGNVVSHKVPRVGNWVHIRYSSVLHAQQALKRNGNTIADRLMIGVAKCTDRETVEEATMNPLNGSLSNFADVSIGAPVLQSTFKQPAGHEDELNGSRPSLNFTDASSFNRSRLSALSRTGMRSLRASEADISLETSTRKDESFLSKFWSFVAPQ
ncbi:MPPN domain containing protein [Aphelenchoides fujianensis]|nr:MPPN domain containing protein [Aphelenchoides fujianensis]